MSDKPILSLKLNEQIENFKQSMDEFAKASTKAIEKFGVFEDEPETHENKEHDYSVTWNQVKNLVDEMIENHDEKVAMADINNAVGRAWNILFETLYEKHGG